MQNVYLTWGVFFTLAILITKVIVDSNKRFDGLLIKHAVEWKWMFFGSFIPVFFFTKAAISLWYFAIPSSGGMIAFFIWLFFDGLYNLLRGYNFWFTGSDDPDDAKMDDFLQKLTLRQHQVFKIGLFILFITIYLFIALR